jgi:hypothetical protein
MEEQQVYKCELCGADVMADLAHHYDAAGKRLSFCSADHLVEWRELDDAVAHARDKDDAGTQSKSA